MLRAEHRRRRGALDEAGAGRPAGGRSRDPPIKSITFTARKVGAFGVICVDSGMDGGDTCGWAHTWMVAKGAFVVRP